MRNSILRLSLRTANNAACGFPFLLHLCNLVAFASYLVCSPTFFVFSHLLFWYHFGILFVWFWLVFAVHVRYRPAFAGWFRAWFRRSLRRVAGWRSAVRRVLTCSLCRRVRLRWFFGLRGSALVVLRSLGGHRLWFLRLRFRALVAVWWRLFRPLVRVACFRPRPRPRVFRASVRVRGHRLRWRLVRAFRSLFSRAVFRRRRCLCGRVRGLRVRVRLRAVFGLCRRLLRCRFNQIFLFICLINLLNWYLFGIITVSNK